MNDDGTKRKLVLLGPPNVGKTSLRLAFFEGHDAQAIVNQSIPPTRRVETTTKGWLGLRINCFDFAGQSLSLWTGPESLSVFGEAEAIVFMVEADPKKKDFITDVWRQIVAKINQICPHARIYVLVHKADLLPADARRGEHFQAVKTWLNSVMIKEFSNLAKIDRATNMPTQPEYFLTSLADGSAFRAMRRILNTFTTKGQAFDKLCSKLAQDAEISDGSVFFIEDETGFMIAEKSVGEFHEAPANSILSAALEALRTMAEKVPKEIKQQKLVQIVATYNSHHFALLPIRNPRIIFGIITPTKTPLGIVNIILSKAEEKITDLVRMFELEH